ncbi:MAG: AraC family transcriptional regulator [Lachnospiraceae bacterium]|nr:AraC family transcriptional regulator [Lachnospiraceae bacterium]
MDTEQNLMEKLEQELEEELREGKKRDGFKGEKMIVLPTEAFSDYVSHPMVRRLYLTDVGFFPKATHHYRERRDGAEEYIFIYCTEGKGDIYVDGKRFTLRENEAFCIPRFRRHRYYACEEDPWSILWVHFKGEDARYYPVEECRIIKFTTANATNRMLFLFELLFRVLEGNYALGNFIYISQVLSLILAETYHREKQNSVMEQNKHVTSVIRYMQSHLNENLTLEQLVDEFGLSKSYLNVIFKKHTQHAPMDFFLHLKMREACRMLKVTELYVYEVAQRLGYRDQYYFSRIFKKVVGVSPNEYKYGDYYHYKD